VDRQPVKLNKAWGHVILRTELKYQPSGGILHPLQWASLPRQYLEVSQDLKPVTPPSHIFPVATNRLEVTQSISNDSSIASRTNNIHEITVIEVFNELERIDVHKSSFQMICRIGLYMNMHLPSWSHSATF
jgi:hypothetical protein